MDKNLKTIIFEEFEQFSPKKREYTSDSSQEDIEELKNSVRLVNGDTILICNPAKPNLFQVGIFFDRIEALTAELKEFYIIVRADRIKWPSISLNRYAKKRYYQLSDKLIHVFIVSGYHPQTNILISFVLDIIFGKISISVHLNIKKAVEEQENIRKQLV